MKLKYYQFIESGLVNGEFGSEFVHSRYYNEWNTKTLGSYC